MNLWNCDCGVPREDPWYTCFLQVIIFCQTLVCFGFVLPTPDLVGLTDVADIIGCSRQYMRKLMVASGSSFPMPVHEGKSALWRLSKILVWLRESKQYQVEDRLLDVASTNMQFNVVNEVLSIDSAKHKDIQRLVSY